MTFASTMDRPKIKGTEWEQRITFTNGVGDTGGDATTVINYVTSVDIQPYGSATPASQCIWNDTPPVTDKVISILTPAGVDGVLIVKGRMRNR